MVRIKEKWRRLPVRLLIMVVATFLPLNVMAIVLSSMILLKTTEQIRESYQRELDMGVEAMVNASANMEDRIEGFVAEYLTELTLAESHDNMVCYEMLDAMKQIFADSGFIGVYYLYDRRSGQVYIKYNSDRYSIQEVEAMKRKLSDYREISEVRSDWTIMRLDHYFFLERVGKYTNYQIGFFIDLEQYMRRLFEESVADGGRIYVRNAEDTLLLVYGADGLYEVEGKRWEEIFHERFLQKNVFYSHEGRERIGYWIPRSNYYGAVRLLYWGLFALAFACLIPLFMLWRMLNRRVITPMRRLRQGMQEIEKEHLDFRIQETDERETIDFRYLYGAFNRMAEEIGLSKEKDVRMYQAELDNLKLQVNPHMLLNSFNMIYSLAQTRNYACIQEFALHLVDYFRYVLRENSTFVSVKREMDFVKNYVEIQKIRFPDTFSFVYDIEEGAEEGLVPPLLLQNFVENAMKYALIPGSVIEVLINIRRKDERLMISIIDTGRGIAPEVLARLQSGEIYLDRMGKRHIGVWNCRRRMETFYGTGTELNIISSQGEGTQVWLDIPFILQEEPVQRRVRHEI